MARRSPFPRALARRVASSLLARIARTADAIAERVEPPPRLRALLSAVRHGPLGSSSRTAPLDVSPTRQAPASWATRVTPQAASHDTAGQPFVDEAPQAPSHTPDAPTTPVTPQDDAALPASYRLVEHLGASLGPAIGVLRESDSLGPGTPPEAGADTLRQLRVATRRLRALVQLFARMLGRKKARQLNQRLREVTRALGPVREQQALLEQLSRAAQDASDPLERAALEHLAVGTRAGTKPLMKKTLRKLKRAGLGPLADDLADALDLICGRLLRAGDGVHASVWPAVESSLRRLLADLPARSPEGELQVLHDVRLAAKRLRYTLDLVRPLLGEHDRTTRRIVKKVQRALGTFHDAALLQSLAARQAEVLQAQGHAMLGRALAARAQTLAQQRDAALATATPWLAAYDPTALAARVAAAFSQAPPAWSVAAPPRLASGDGSSQPQTTLLE